MPALPVSSDFTGSGVTEGQFKTAITALRDFLSGLLGADGLSATALATLGAFGAGYVAKTAAYTVVAGDKGKVIDASGTWTLGLPAAATAGAGFTVVVRNGGAGVITVDPNAAELVNGAATAVLAAGQTILLACTGAAWVSLGAIGNDAAAFLAITGTALQSSSVDATVGRIMRVAAFGLGGAGAVVTDYSAPPNYSQFIAGGGSSVTADPPPANAPFRPGIAAYRASSNRVGIAHFTLNALAIRNYTAGVADHAWNLLFGQQNILGSVTQAAGVPTGALIERGSSAAGEYVRFADGTQICTQTLTASASAGVAWTFPGAFIAAPVVVGTAQATVLSCVMLDAAAGATSCTISARDKADARRADTVTLTAIGRWF